MFDLAPEQMAAVNKMSNGCILCGKVGSGKSRTALEYVYRNTEPTTPIFIITTATKRDTKEWDEEIYPMTSVGYIHCVDSWNNIKKYVEIKNAFFIFDEQRVVGKGVWVQSFISITKNNKWILLSATPGDTWSDYVPVFIAHGFYKNRTQFEREHAIWNRYTKYPSISRYYNTGILLRYRHQILVNIDYVNDNIRHSKIIHTTYNKELYKQVTDNRWDPYENEPIQDAGGLCRIQRRIVNEDKSRVIALYDILENHSTAIIFYNFDYELMILRKFCADMGIVYGERNGHKHDPLPTGDKWLYLVQYNSGAEGWNCIQTNCIIFYSLNYSYKIMEQACGRIDRRNTIVKDLYYYKLKSESSIDNAIYSSILRKKEFNAVSYVAKLPRTKNMAYNREE